MMSTVQSRPAAFDAIAAQYDDLFTNSLIGRAQRDAVWEIAKHHLRPGSSVLELNCGTGEDARFLAKYGMNVVGFDVSEKMVEVAKSRELDAEAEGTLEFLTLAIEDVRTLSPAHRFDAVFSNFSGLNCVLDLRKVAADLAELLTYGSTAVLCFSNKHCLWEAGWYVLQGRIKKAFRRWTSKPVLARIGTERVTVRYPSIREIRAAFTPHFSVTHVYGIGVAVPPSYLEPWMRRMPNLLRAFCRVDTLVGSWRLFRSIGDHVVLVMERATP